MEIVFSPSYFRESAMITPTPKFRILVVDDEESVCDAIKMILEFCGYDVETANAGHEAMTFLEKGRVDLLITDYMMRGMNGQQLARRAKDHRPSLPVLMITAFAGSLDLSTLAVDAVLSKPFKIDELRDTVATLLPPRTPPGSSPASN